MIKRNINILCLAVILVGSVPTAKGQRNVKDFLTHKVIVNHENRSIVAFVKPVKRISIDADKRYYWFSPNHIGNTQGGFSGKLLNGDYQEFFANKQPRESGYIDKGLKGGVWKSWDENGKLEADHNWASGRMNGMYHRYDSVGKVQESGIYKNGLLHGRQKRYTADGVQELRYKSGKITEHKKIGVPKFLRKIFYKKNKSDLTDHD